MRLSARLPLRHIAHRPRHLRPKSSIFGPASSRPSLAELSVGCRAFSSGLGSSGVEHAMRTVADHAEPSAVDHQEMLQQLGLNFHEHATLLATSIEPPEAGYYPTDLIRWIVDSLHTSMGLEWWAAIALTTVGIRTFIFPLTVKMMQSTSKLAVAKPEIAAIMARMNAEKANNPNFDQVAYGKEIQAVYSKHGTHPLSTLGLMFTQFPIFISMFMGLRGLELYHPDICTGGAFWFPDLTAGDPLHYMPFMVAGTFGVTVLLGDAGMENAQSAMMKKVMLGLGVVTVPLTWNFPAAVMIYMVANNTFSILQTTVLNKIPGVKPALGILPPPPPEDVKAEAEAQFAGLEPSKTKSLGIDIPVSNTIPVGPAPDEVAKNVDQQAGDAAKVTINRKKRRNRRRKRR